MRTSASKFGAVSRECDVGTNLSETLLYCVGLSYRVSFVGCRVIPNIAAQYTVHLPKVTCTK